MGIWASELPHPANYGWSPRLRSIWGIGPEVEVTPQLAFSLIHPDDREPVQQAMAKALDPERDGRFNVIHRVCRPDGTTAWVQAWGRTLFAGPPEGRRPVHSVGVILDITERKRVEEALRESEQRFRAFMDHSPTVAWITDAEGHYVYLNAPFRNRFGIRLEDGVGRTDYDFWPLALAEERQRNAQEVLASGRAQSLVEQTPAPDGTQWYWLNSRFPIRDASGRTLVGGIGIDITERKSLEQEILEVVGAEQRRIGQELHDGVGQELTGLRLLADALAQRLLQGQHADVALAQKLARGIDRVHRQIRSLSHGLAPVAVDPEGLRSALEELASSIADGCHCTCIFEGIFPIEVQDPQLAMHLFRIAQEAVSNALRHGQPRLIRIGLRIEPELLTLSVTDDGKGMDAPSRPSEGMGLRLMRYRADGVGGILTIEAAKGGGTVVTCRIPRNPNDGQEFLTDEA